MASAEVLKEYLVRLGFSQDQKSTADFKSSLATTAEGVSKLGTSLQDMAQRAGAAATQVAESLDQMFFAAQRSGASVSALQGLGLAFDRMGLSAGSAQNLVANLFEFIKTQPAAESILQKLGVNMRGPNGELRETVAIFNDLSKSLTHRASTGRPMDMNFAAQMSQMLTGASWHEFLAQTQMQDRQAKFQGEHQSMLRKAGFDPDKQKQDTQGFMDQLALLGDAFDILRQKIGTALFAAFGIDMQTFRDWLVKHSGEIADTLVGIVKDIVDFSKKVYDWWEKLTPQEKEQIELVGKLFAAWRLLGIVFGTTAWMSPIMTFFVGANAEALTLYGLLTGISAILTAPAFLAALAALAALWPKPTNQGEDEFLKSGQGRTDVSGPSGKPRPKADELRDYLIAQGVSPVAASAMVVHAIHESGMDPGRQRSDNGRAGMWQHDLSRQERMQQHYESMTGKHVPWTELPWQTQADLFLWELKNRPGEKAHGKALFTAAGPAEASAAMASTERFANWDQAGNPEAARRAAETEAYVRRGIAPVSAEPPKPPPPRPPMTLKIAEDVQNALKRLQEAREHLIDAKGHPGELSGASAEYAAAQQQLIAAARAAAAQKSLNTTLDTPGMVPGSVSNVNSGNVNSNNVNTVDAHQVVTLHMNADSHDPQAIAKELEYSLDRSQGNLVRYLSKAIT